MMGRFRDQYLFSNNRNGQAEFTALAGIRVYIMTVFLASDLDDVVRLYPVLRKIDAVHLIYSREDVKFRPVTRAKVSFN